MIPTSMFIWICRDSDEIIWTAIRCVLVCCLVFFCPSPYLYLDHSFSASALFTSWAGTILYCEGLYTVGCLPRSLVLPTIGWPYSTPHPSCETKNVSRHCQMSPEEEKSHPQLKTTDLDISANSIILLSLHWVASYFVEGTYSVHHLAIALASFLSLSY